MQTKVCQIAELRSDFKAAIFNVMGEKQKGYKVAL